MAASVEEISNIGEVIELVTAEEYDPHRAKLRSSLSWLLSKVYGSNIPKELQDPFYETAEGQLVLRPVLVNLMSSSELYCQACSNMFPETHTQWQGHWSIIQVLSRKGIYISEVQESAVTETVLVQTAPFRLKAHLALIDALMKAYISEVASVEKVVKAVRQITTFHASSELPGTPEEALIFWINKVCSVLGTEGGSRRKSDEIIEGIVGQKERVYSKSLPQCDPVQVPLLGDLMSDVGDGCSIGALIAFYKPHLLNMKGLCFKEGIGIADSLHNLYLIREFCRNHLPFKNFYISYEDFLYTHDDMRVNITAFLADLFTCFEGPNEAEDQGLSSGKCSSEKVEGIVAAGKKSSQGIYSGVQISQATKRSFHKQSVEETANNLGMGRPGSFSPISHQPLLSKRIAGRHCIPQEEGGTSVIAPTKRRTGRRAVSLFTPQDREIVHKSVLAWQDDQEMLRRTNSNNSSDSDKSTTSTTKDTKLNQNSNANNNLSLDLSGLQSPIHCDNMNPDNIAWNQHHRVSPLQQQLSDRRSTRTPTSLNADQQLEPLMPALLKPTKEKETNLSKAEERGDSKFLRKKKTTSPTEAHVPQVQRSAAQSPYQKRQHYVETDSNFSDQSDITCVSPLTPETTDGRNQSPISQPEPPGVKGRVFEAFVVEANSETNIPQKDDTGSHLQESDIKTASSYTVKDRPVSAHAARAAGIPVLTDSEDVAITDQSREGSIASSGEYSDHESQKIHQEYKMRESNLLASTLGNKGTDTNINNNNKPLLLISDHLIKSSSNCDKDPAVLNTTNFAELKRLKDKLGYNLDKVDGNALIYMQSGSPGGPYDKTFGVDYKPMFVIKQNQGQEQNDSDKTSSSQQSRMPPFTGSPDNAALEAKDSNPGSSEMQQLRLKLEQKRKDIERKKHRQEAQQSKMRQQLGKAAFMRVVSKHVEGEGDEPLDTVRTEQTSSLAQIQARLGYPPQSLPFGHSSNPQPILPQKQESLIPADASAQRFTDWRAQSQQHRIGGAGISTLAAADRLPSTLDPAQQQYFLRSTGGSDSNNTALSSGNKAFSREGIQQTIDTVKNKWFKNESDLTSFESSAKDDDIDGESFRLHDGDLLAGTRPRSFQDHSYSPARSHSQSPLHGASQHASSLPNEAVFPRTTESPSQHMTDKEYQEYDSSLDKLNTSLTELQGEIMRLSLQNEQLKAAQSPVNNQAIPKSDSLPTAGVPLSSTQSRPLHGIPQKVQYGQNTRQGVPFSSSQQHLAHTTALPTQNDFNITATPNRNAAIDSLTPALSDISYQNKSHDVSGSSPNQFKMASNEADDIMSISNDGFFVSFGENSTPKRIKPKFAEHRSRGASPAPNGGHSSGPIQQVGPTVVQATPTVVQADASFGQFPAAVTVSNGNVVISSQVAANLASQTIVPTLTSHHADISDESSPNIGFTIKDEAAVAKESAVEDDMQKKRIKLIEMQRKRKEEQERRKSEKEAEVAKKHEEKILKEEELERKKAEEKARRELIFQQYIQKKQEDEDTSTIKVQSRKRDGSASKQRPKSMFVKTKIITSDHAPDSGSSSQEDLNFGGRSTPGVMSAMRSSFNFRLPQPSNIRKAVSCNTLQGAVNGALGPTTYRRPTSPDLNRMKQQRQRSNNLDSGSESSSNTGMEYAGPKLFVKPSARSNRHIIVNAISHCCLAGSVNTEMKNKVLEDLAKCDATHFLILFRDAGCQYRGLFVFSPETEEAFKIHGVGPKHIVNEMCEKFYKYNSGAKSFSEITSTKHLSVSVDAVVLYTAVWKSVKAVIKR